jgi:hypothetical protein
MVSKTPPGDSDDSVADGEEVRILVAIALETVVVKASTIKLGDEALRPPERVHLVTRDAPIDLGPGEGVALDEGEECVFER